MNEQIVQESHNKETEKCSQMKECYQNNRRDIYNSKNPCVHIYFHNHSTVLTVITMALPWKASCAWEDNSCCRYLEWYML